MRRLWTAAGVVTAISLASAGPAGAYWFKHCSYGTHWSGQTAMVADVNPGPADAVHTVFGFSARQELLAVYDGSLYFQADDGQSGAELWRASAGTATQVAEIAPGPTGSSPHAFAVFQGQLYFAATTPSTGEELFRFDGSSASLAAETHPGNEGGEIFGLTVFDGALYFSVPNDGEQVWRFDGTTAEPVTAINAAPGRVVAFGHRPARAFVPFGGKLYYVRSTPLPEHYELWVYDGAKASMLKALTHGNDIVSYVFDLVVYQGALYFGVVAPVPSSTWQDQDELWRYTGQGAPVKVATFGSAATGTQPGYFQVYQGKLYFEVGSTLHRYDGSVVEDLSAVVPGLPDFPKNLSLYPSADRLFFSGSASDWTGNEPHLFDGSGAHLLKDIMPSSASSYPGSFPTYAEEADGLYFFAEDEAHGRELWRTSGQAIPVLDCYIVVAAVWDNWLEWPMDRRNVVVATWYLAPGEEERLVSRETAVVTPGEPWRTQVLSLETRRRELPEGFALATAVFDRRTGRRVDQGFEVVGAPEPRARTRMEAAAERLLRDRSLREVASERVRPLGEQRGRGQ